MSTRTLTALVRREGDGYVSFCLDLDVASRGKTVEEAKSNLRKAAELFLESAAPAEIVDRLAGEMYFSPLEVNIA